MRVREVIPFGKSDEEMEARESEKTVEEEGGRQAEGERFSAACSLRVIGCLTFLSKSG